VLTKKPRLRHYPLSSLTSLFLLPRRGTKSCKRIVSVQSNDMARLFFWAVCLCSLLSTAVFGAEPPRSPEPAAAWLLKTQHKPLKPHSGESVEISAYVLLGFTNVTLQYQIVEPGAYIELHDPAFADHWISVAMRPATDSQAALYFHATLPAELQKHRRLIRYRFSALDTNSQTRLAPEPAELPPNYAYFVYDGVPGWTGAVNPKSDDPKLATSLTFPPEAMRRVQVQQLLGNKTSIENATWYERAQGKEYKYTGTLVVDG